MKTKVPETSLMFTFLKQKYPHFKTFEFEYSGGGYDYRSKTEYYGDGVWLPDETEVGGFQ